jgi:hypothetical protein
VAILEHVAKLHVAQAADRCAADIGTQRPARVGVLEKIRNGIADEHFIPDADAHRRTFLAVHGLAAEVGLIETPIEHIAFANNVDDQPGRDRSDEPKL